MRASDYSIHFCITWVQTCTTTGYTPVRSFSSFEEHRAWSTWCALLSQALGRNFLLCSLAGNITRITQWLRDCLNKRRVWFVLSAKNSVADCNPKRSASRRTWIPSSYCAIRFIRAVAGRRGFFCTTNRFNILPFLTAHGIFDTQGWHTTFFVTWTDKLVPIKPFSYSRASLIDVMRPRCGFF